MAGGGNKQQQQPATSPLNDLTKLLQAIAQTGAAVTAAKQGVSRAKTPADAAAARAQLANASQAYQAALAAKNSGTTGIPKEAIWIAAGLGAVLLLTSLNRPQLAKPQAA